MRLKPVPEAPGDLDALAAARRAVPLVPGTEDDCCARLRQRLGLDSRDAARTWLTFLRALGLVEETRRGFARTRGDPEEDALAVAFRERVYAAREVLDVLAAAADPLDADAVFERVEDVVPRWERYKDPTWRDTWRERVRRLLEWAVLFGLAARAGEGYRPAAD